MNQKRRKKPFLSLSTFTGSAPSLSKNMPSVRLFNFTLLRLKDVVLVLSLLFILYLLLHAPPSSPSPLATTFPHAFTSAAGSSPTTRDHLLFSIASSSSSFIHRKPYIRLWYDAKTTRAFAFLDRTPPHHTLDPTLPPVIISEDTSRFPYTFKGGLRSAIRVARVVKEAVGLNQTNVRWFVFGDDDTVFFVENLAKTLSKYDHHRWYYIGSNSESYDQNLKYSFDMAFGGGGFAISYSLANVLARVLDSCLARYAHLYGSDARIFSCLAELGVGLTHELGFHQVDMRGNLFGLLSAHPLTPLVSLHHLDAAEPIFPNVSKIQAMEHLFKAVNIDPTRILQQTVCYDRRNSLTFSVAWGYSIQVFEGNEFLPDLLSLQRTFVPWRRSTKIDFSHFMFNMREYPRHHCKRPAVFFMGSFISSENGVLSNYSRHAVEDCPRADAVKNLKRIEVFSYKLKLDTEQMMAPRRQCCDVASLSKESMVIGIRQCGSDELISMHS